MARCHVVVGGGSTSMFLCHTLLEGDDVILIERGSSTESAAHNAADNKILYDPSLWYAARMTDYAAMQRTVSQPCLSYRRIMYQQGHGMGGTSNINAMILTGGHRSVYDMYWPAAWNSRRMSRLLSEVRNILQPQLNQKNIWSQYMDTAAENMDNDSFLDDNAIRSSYFPCCRDNRRILIEEVLHHHRPSCSGKLTTYHHMEALYVLFEGDRAVGVVARSKLSGELMHFVTKNDGEVILCAGAFESPRLLCSSLMQREHKDIPAKQKLSNVIARYPMLGVLKDHVHFPMICLGNWKVLLASGIRASSHSSNGIHGWIYLDRQGKLYDVNRNPRQPPSLQLLLVDGSMLPDILPELCLPVLDRPHSYIVWLYMRLLRPLLHAFLTVLSKTAIVRYLCLFVFGFLLCNVQPYSSGQLNFHADDATSEVKYEVDPKYLSDARDKDMLVTGSYAARSYLSSMKKAGLRYMELRVGRSCLDMYIRCTAQTYFHVCGSCRMDDDRSIGVVDSKLCVHGLKGLRIADASVFPAIPTGPISAVCMAIGLAAGEDILSADKVVSASSQ